ncbi:MAG TPA: glycerophosphodiester phosphodiesterase family protein [Micromonosporaceae bacterium]
MSDNPLVFAHRGSSAALPEHTLGAYLRALDEGADGLECDVRLTRDGHLVCVHDRRLERTSNGRGLVSARTLAELGELDFGSWHRATGTPEPVLTLDRLLGAVREAGRPVRLLIETKHPSRHGADVERRVVDLLAAHRMLTDDDVSVTVMSFSPLALRRIRELAPALPTVQLLEALPPGLRPGRLPFGSRIAGPGIGLVRTRPGLIPALRAAGNEVYVWTVNEPSDVELVLRYGVDGIITDRPRHVLDRLGR